MLSACFSVFLFSIPTPPKGWEFSFDQIWQNVLQFLQSQESGLESKIGKEILLIHREKQIYILLNMGESAPEFLITVPPLTEWLVISVGEFRLSAWWLPAECTKLNQKL